MKLSKATRKKHRWLLKELKAISDELEEMDARFREEVMHGRDAKALSQNP